MKVTVVRALLALWIAWASPAYCIIASPTFLSFTYQPSESVPAPVNVALQAVYGFVHRIYRNQSSRVANGEPNTRFWYHGAPRYHQSPEPCGRGLPVVAKPQTGMGDHVSALFPTPVGLRLPLGTGWARFPADARAGRTGVQSQ